MGGGTELIFVEGGSSDGTWERIQEVMASYQGPLKLAAYKQMGKGKGDAVRLGFAKATGDLLMILDADLTVPPEDLPVFYEAAVDGYADYLQGTRLVYPMEAGAMRFFNKLGNIAFSRLFTHLLQQPIKDTLCGTKVLWRRDYERIAANRHVFGDFDPFGDFDLIFGAARLEPEAGRDPGALPGPGLRRDQHSALEARLAAAEDVGAGRAQAALRVTGGRAGVDAELDPAVRERTLARFQAHRQAWAANPALRALYQRWYERVRAELPDRALGRWIEIGSGPGLARELIPELELSDVVQAPWHAHRLAAESLPFGDGQVGALVLFDVLHHLRSPARVPVRGHAGAGAGRPGGAVRAVRQPAVVPHLPLPARGGLRPVGGSAGRGRGGRRRSVRGQPGDPHAVCSAATGASWPAGFRCCRW